MERDGNSESVESVKTLWCPKCGRGVEPDDPLLRATFTPQTAQLHPDGELDWGNLGDVFMDYDHLECGTHVRIVSNAGWQEELGEYVADVRNAFLELTIDGEYVRREGDGDHFLGIAGFSAAVAERTEEWGPTYDALLGMYESAVKAHDERKAKE